jgi:hypothetical protein
MHGRAAIRPALIKNISSVINGNAPGIYPGKRKKKKQTEEREIGAPFFSL